MTGTEKNKSKNFPNKKKTKTDQAMNNATQFKDRVSGSHSRQLGLIKCEARCSNLGIKPNPPVKNPRERDPYRLQSWTPSVSPPTRQWRELDRIGEVSPTTRSGCRKRQRSRLNPRADITHEDTGGTRIIFKSEANQYRALGLPS